MASDDALADTLPFSVAPEGLRLAVRLTPRADRNALDGVAAGADGRPALLLRVAAPPVDGSAAGLAAAAVVAGLAASVAVAGLVASAAVASATALAAGFFAVGLRAPVLAGPPAAESPVAESPVAGPPAAGASAAGAFAVAFSAVAEPAGALAAAAFPAEVFPAEPAVALPAAALPAAVGALPGAVLPLTTAVSAAAVAAAPSGAPVPSADPATPLAAPASPAGAALSGAVSSPSPDFFFIRSVTSRTWPMLANTDRNAFAGASLTLSLTCGNRIFNLSLKGDGRRKDFTRTRCAMALWRCAFLAGYLDGCTGPSQQTWST